jgi:PPE-repeat protein
VSSGKKIIAYLIAGVILFGAGFWTGTYYQKKQTTSALPDATTGDRPTMPSGTSGNTPPSGQRTGGPGGGGVSGEIITKADKSLTVKKTDGSTVIVYFDDSTTVAKSETASSSALVVGTSVQVMGTTNSDKSVAGKSIMIQNKTSE